MALTLFVGLSGALMLLRPIDVDFTLDAISQPAAVAVQPLMRTAPTKKQPDDTGSAYQVVRPPLPAVGFGEDVPLEFAVRQLVPATMHVDYGDSVDRQLRVSWQGGKPWDEVLRDATAPLGLRVVTSGHTVRIAE